MKPALPYILGLGVVAGISLLISMWLPTPPEFSVVPSEWQGDPEEPLFHNGLPLVRDKNAPGNGAIPKGYRLADPHPTRTLPPSQ